MSEEHTYKAFLAVLVTMVIMAVCGAIAMRTERDASAFMAAITGLLTALGFFRPGGKPSQAAADQVAEPEPGGLTPAEMAPPPKTGGTL